MYFFPPSLSVRLSQPPEYSQHSLSWFPHCARGRIRVLHNKNRTCFVHEGSVVTHPLMDRLPWKHQGGSRHTIIKAAQDEGWGVWRENNHFFLSLNPKVCLKPRKMAHCEFYYVQQKDWIPHFQSDLLALFFLLLPSLWYPLVLKHHWAAVLMDINVLRAVCWLSRCRISGYRTLCHSYLHLEPPACHDAPCTFKDQKCFIDSYTVYYMGRSKIR